MVSIMGEKPVRVVPHVCRDVTLCRLGIACSLSHGRTFPFCRYIKHFVETVTEMSQYDLLRFRADGQSGARVSLGERSKTITVEMGRLKKDGIQGH